MIPTQDSEEYREWKMRFVTTDEERKQIKKVLDEATKPWK